jgi:hypothetical protein
MAAAAHTPGGYGGVPQSVGEDFNQADKGTKMLSNAMKGKKHSTAAMAKAMRKKSTSGSGGAGM